MTGGILASLYDRLASEPLTPGLYLVSTPIGNLGDMSPRALSVLARASDVYCEDTRHSRRLFSAFGIERRLSAYHDHSDERDRLRIIDRMRSGCSVALISDAGTPLISDPGHKLVRDALDAGVKVFPIPGPAAAIAALTMSGVPANRFMFIGFPPPRSAAREETFRELASIPATLIFYEAMNRLDQTLADMATVFVGREVSVAREITKLHEELRRGAFPDFAVEDFSAFARGEAVIIVGPPVSGLTLDDDAIVERLNEALKVMSVKDAADTVASALGMKRKRVYDLAAALKAKGLTE